MKLRKLWARRPLLMTCVLLVCFFVLVVAVGLGEILRRGLAGPMAHTDYIAQINAMNPLPPEKDRAWPVYMEAVRTQPPLSEELWNVEQAPFGTEDFDRLREIHAAHRASADAYLRAAELESLGLPLGTDPLPGLEEAMNAGIPEDERYWEDEEDEEVESELDSFQSLYNSTFGDHFGTMRGAARYLADEARIAMADGDPDRATRCFRAMYRIADHTRLHGFLIEDLVAQAIRSLAAEAINDSVRDLPGVLRDEHLDALQRTIRAAPELFGDRVMAGERLFFLDTQQWLFSDAGRVNASFIRYRDLGVWADLSDALNALYDEEDKPLVPASVRAGIASFFSSSYDEVLATYDRWTEAERAWLEKPIWERGPNPIMNEVDAWLVGESLTDDLAMDSLASSFSMTGSVMRSGPDRLMMVESATIAALAVERHRLRTGRLPGGLAELVPGDLERLPLDMFDGAPIRYRVVDGRPVLYSIGTDRNDDGGRPAQDAFVWHSAEQSAELESQEPDRYDGDWVIYGPDPDVPEEPELDGDADDS